MNTAKDEVTFNGPQFGIRPVSHSWTREELQNCARNWMAAHASMHTMESYYTSLGLLVDFVTDLFDGVNVEEKK